MAYYTLGIPHRERGEGQIGEGGDGLTSEGDPSLLGGKQPARHMKLTSLKTLKHEKRR